MCGVELLLALLVHKVLVLNEAVCDFLFAELVEEDGQEVYELLVDFSFVESTVARLMR